MISNMNYEESFMNVTYKVEIGFLDYYGASETVEVYADENIDETKLLDTIIANGLVDDFFEAVEVENLGNNEYIVVVNFAGYPGTEEQYTVIADNEEDAIEYALYDAKWDITINNYTIVS